MNAEALRGNLLGILLAFLLFLLALIGHEIGHALILRECGIRIKRIGLGIPNGPRLEFTPKWAGKFFGGGCTIVVSPILLGAFVEPVEEDTKKPLSLLMEIAYLGGGVLANFVLVCFLSAALICVSYELTQNIDVRYFFGMKLPGTAWVIATGFACGGIVLWACRKFISIIFPFVGIYLIFVIISAFTVVPIDTLAQSNGSIVLIGEWISKVPDVRGAILFGLVINLVLGLTNLLPFYPLDGGQMVARSLERTSTVAARVFQRLSFIPVALLMIWALGADAWRLSGYFR